MLGEMFEGDYFYGLFRKKEKKVHLYYNEKFGWKTTQDMEGVENF